MHNEPLNFSNSFKVVDFSRIESADRHGRTTFCSLGYYVASKHLTVATPGRLKRMLASRNAGTRYSEVNNIPFLSVLISKSGSNIHRDS